MSQINLKKNLPQKYIFSSTTINCRSLPLSEIGLRVAHNCCLSCSWTIENHKLRLKVVFLFQICMGLTVWSTTQIIIINLIVSDM